MNDHPASSGDPPKPRYRRPRILAIDLADEDAAEIARAGFNLERGSFGTPIEVKKSADYVPVNINGHLPGATEQEIVFVDLAGPEADAGQALGEEPVGKGMWQQMNTGVVDPRPYMMYAAREFFDRIYAHGGIFVLFAQPRQDPDYRWAGAREIAYGETVAADNWSLLTVLSDLRTGTDFGREIEPVDVGPAFASIAAAIRSEGTFTCTLDPYASIAGRWLTLAASKYGDPVAGILAPEKDSGDGIILVLPRLARKGVLLRALLEGLLPDLAPKLFPEDERQAWVDDDAYAPAGVVELRAQIRGVREHADAEVKRLEGEIESRRAEHSYLRDLLTATSEELVAAVRTTLGSLGFTDVRDVDSEDGVKGGRLYEDLQIHTTPLVLVEVKGINGRPRDEDALEVLKYIRPRTREWKDPDVRGLTIVNHQRGLPPLERDENVFQGDQVENAEGQDIGLLTTWDLYRLARGFERNGWSHSDVAALATAAGRVEALPAHYTPIGRVHNYFADPRAVIVELTEGKGVEVGATVAFVGPVDFVERKVTSIQVDGEAREVSPTDGRIGLQMELDSPERRQGTPVYLVSAGDAAEP